MLLAVAAAGIAYTITSTQKNDTSSEEKMMKDDSQVMEKDEEVMEKSPEDEQMEKEEDTEVQVDAEVSTDVREEEIVEDVNDEITSELEYNNGDYTVNTSYQLPNGGSHDMDITVSLTEDKVSAVSIIFDGDTSGGSSAIQGRFVTAMQEEVIGAEVDSISLSRTGGASLTTKAFSGALETVKNQAKG